MKNTIQDSVLAALKNGSQLTSAQISSKFKAGNPQAVIQSLRFAGYPVYLNKTKTGARKSAHWFQIGIYYLMLKAIARNQGLPIPSLFSLGLFYNDGKVPPVENTFKDNLIELIGPNSIDEIFLDGTRNRLQEVLEITSQEQLPEARPSINNCRFCKFNNQCPSAIKSDLTIVAESLF